MAENTNSEYFYTTKGEEKSGLSIIFREHKGQAKKIFLLSVSHLKKTRSEESWRERVSSSV